MTDISFFHSGNNAQLIHKVMQLGYIRESDYILDATYGRGLWWTALPGFNVTGNDLYDGYVEFGYDFRELPETWDDAFDVVAYDPPYRLNGRPDPAFDGRYGTAERTTVESRIRLIYDGFFGVVRCVKPGGYLLVKLQDQVVSGRVHWLTVGCLEAAKLLAELGTHLALVDRFDMPPARPQPSGRRQVHARRGSTLLVFQKKGK